MNFEQAFRLLAIGLLLVPAAAMGARTHLLACSIAHQVRANGSELRSASIAIRNNDLSNPATVERITIRNVFGTVVHDSGPAAGAPIPLNTDFAVPLDITVVPPGASYYLRTNHIWGNDGLPAAEGGNEAGSAMSAIVQISKKGKEDLLVVSTRPRSRERIATPTGFAEGAERSATSSACGKLN